MSVVLDDPVPRKGLVTRRCSIHEWTEPETA